MAGMSRRRVLLVLDSLVAGGAETSTVALLPYLAARDLDVELATLWARPGLQDRVRHAGVQLHELEPTGRVGWIRQLRALIADRRPDLVHTCLFEADVAGRTAAALARVPSVSTLASDTYSQTHLHAPHLSPVRVRASQAVDIATARLARRIHAVSFHVAEVMSRRLLYPRDRIDVVFRGRPADLATPRPAARRAIRDELGWGSDLVVLAVARQEEAKGLDRLLAAWPSVQATMGSARLAVAGRDGAHTGTLRQLACRSGLDVDQIFLGHRADVSDLLAAADLFVMPSRREGMPGALLEAMAANVPAVASDLPQVREVAPAGEVVVVDAGDPTELSAAIVGELTDRATAMTRAGRARDRFLTQFTLDHAADGMAEFYQRALDPGPMRSLRR